MTDQAVIIRDVSEIVFGEIRIEPSKTGESHYRLLTIKSGGGGVFRIKLCCNNYGYGLQSIIDEEMDSATEMPILNADKTLVLLSEVEIGPAQSATCLGGLVRATLRKGAK